MIKINNFVRYINEKANLWLIFLVYISVAAAFLYINSYDDFLIVRAQRRIHYYSLIPFIPYFIFLWEYKNCTYEKRYSKLRHVSNLIQAPSFIISAISLTILLNPLSLSHTQSVFFANALNDVVSTLFLTIVTYVVDKLIKRKGNELIIKPTPKNYHIQPM